MGSTSLHPGSKVTRIIGDREESGHVESGQVESVAWSEKLATFVVLVRVGGVDGRPVEFDAWRIREVRAG